MELSRQNDMSKKIAKFTISFILILVIIGVFSFSRPQEVSAAVTLIANTSAAGFGETTTAGINTTGADFIVIGLAIDDGYNGTPSDSKSNTWTQVSNTYTQTNVRVRMWYTRPTSVGTSHTFTVPANPIGSIFVAAFSGVNLSTTDQQNGANGFASSLATGSITPTQNGALLISLLGINAVGLPISINNSFTLIDDEEFVSGTNYGGGMAWRLQDPAAAINPTWTRTNTNGMAATVISFKIFVPNRTAVMWFQDDDEI